MRGRLAALTLAVLLGATGAGAEPLARAALPGLPRAGAVDAEPRRASLDARLAEIQRRVQGALDYPPLPRLKNRSGEVRLRFEIGPDGRGREVEVVRSSGSRGLDAAAVRAVLAAGELPWVYGALELPVHFELREEDGGPGQP